MFKLQQFFRSKRINHHFVASKFRNQGKSLDGMAVQFNAEKCLFELVFDKNKKQTQDQKQDSVNIPKKILAEPIIILQEWVIVVSIDYF